jgi:hypothetical protein
MSTTPPIVSRRPQYMAGANAPIPGSSAGRDSAGDTVSSLHSLRAVGESPGRLVAERSDGFRLAPGRPPRMEGQ